MDAIGVHMHKLVHKLKLAMLLITYHDMFPKVVSIFATSTWILFTWPPTLYQVYCVPISAFFFHLLPVLQHLDSVDFIMFPKLDSSKLQGGLLGV
jgi:hypothetical protein